jgi:Zn-dependent protease with chaperone function
MLGARRVDFATRTALERQFLNVTEEMAIASGMPVPMLYVLDREMAINAFVAGYSAQQSVMVVTQGTLEQLSRDELQGVIGHEFSHILNGDMRINMRLLAILAGILAIGQLGGFLMRSVSDTNNHRHSRDRSRNNNGAPVAFFFGFGLWLIGYIGLFFGRLIKAAVSHERETLADAASVQFTRHPEGLAGALYKVSLNGSQLANLHAEEMSHMCFGESLSFSRLFATHPPIEERIEAIAPAFLTRMKYRQPTPGGVAHADAETAASSPLLTGFAPSEQGPNSEPALTEDKVFEFEPVVIPVAAPIPAVPISVRVGDITVDDLLSAQRLHQNLPVEVSRALQTTTGAKAVLFALITHHQQTDANTIRDFFSEQKTFAAWVEQLWLQLQALDERLALPIVELCLPRLSLLDAQDAKDFLVSLRSFVLLNNQVSVFEFSLLKIIEQQIQPTPTVFRSHPIDKLAQPVAHLVATLLQYGAHPPAQRAQVYQQLLLPVLKTVPTMPDDERLNLRELDRTLRQFRYLTPEGKRTLINLAAATIQSDGILHVAEYELLRAIAALLSCPLPLLQLKQVTA